MRAAVPLTASPPAVARRVIELGHRHPDGAASLAILLLATAVFGRALVPGAVLAPADIAMVAFPWAAVAPGLEPANPLAVDVAFMFHPWLVRRQEQAPRAFLVSRATACVDDARALELAGRHEIELRYWPRSLTWGLVVSLGATALIAGLVWRGRRP